MKILAAFDKYKDAMSAGRACAALSGALEALGEPLTLSHPLTDGGEGFCRF